MDDILSYSLTLQPEQRRRLMHLLGHAEALDEHQVDADASLATILEQATPRRINDMPTIPLCQDSGTTAAAIIHSCSQALWRYDGDNNYTWKTRELQRFYFNLIRVATDYLEYRMHPDRCAFEDGTVDTMR